MGNMFVRPNGPVQRRTMPQHAPLKVGRKRNVGDRDSSNKLPKISPKCQCLLRLLKMNRVHDFLLMEQEFIQRQSRYKTLDNKRRIERKLVQTIRGTPVSLARIHELFDDQQHAVVVVEGSKREWFVPILSIVDKELVRVNALCLVKAGGAFKNIPLAVVGVVSDSVDSMVSIMKMEKAPQESYADVGGLTQQIQEIKEAVELPLTHPEYYEEMGIKPPKGVILYGPPGTGKTLLAKAVANQTSAAFLSVSGSELIQRHLGDGPKMVRELFRVAEENAPSIVFIDEIDAVGTKRFDSHSAGEREIQRTMLELLNQLDGFDSRGEIKVLMATNKIESLDPALIRPGRIDRKIEFPTPDESTRRRIFSIHTSRMQLDKDVNLDEFIQSRDDLSGADIKAMCTEAGLLALRKRRMRVTMEDFRKSKENVLYRKRDIAHEGIYH